MPTSWLEVNSNESSWLDSESSRIGFFDTRTDACFEAATLSCCSLSAATLSSLKSVLIIDEDGLISFYILTVFSCLLAMFKIALF